MEWALKQASTEMQTASPLVHWPQRLLQLSFENDWRRDARNLPIMTSSDEFPRQRAPDVSNASLELREITSTYRKTAEIQIIRGDR